MSRTLTILFRRNPSKDRQDETANYEGYQPYWPDGNPVAVGLDAFCRHGQRLLGLGRHLEGRGERLVNLTCLPLQGREDRLHKIPGYRVRRFFIERCDTIGRIHFLDGTPTSLTFDIHRDEPIVLQWIGLVELKDGERQWFDLAAGPADGVPFTRRRVVGSEA